jgi:hypothetical protein
MRVWEVTVNALKIMIRNRGLDHAAGVGVEEKVMLNYCTLDAGLLARSQYMKSPATGHLDTGFSWFPCVYK